MEQRARVPMPETVNRRHFEVCIFSHILLELKSGDLYIEGSSDYGDYYGQLIDWEQYAAAIEEYGQQVELPTEPKLFVAHVQQWLTTCATAFDDTFPANADVDYQRDRLVIRKPKPKLVPGAAQLKAQIAARIRPVNLLDSLIDTELWLNWTRCFKPKSGYDGLLHNQSEIQPDTIHGDTQAQSATVFALAYLLGIALMPRIRNWKDLTFYRPTRSVRYKHVDTLFTDNVNWESIETHLPDMLRVALSVKAGKINASTVLRKLGTNSTKNKLYQAFHALGCAVRTGFLLQYLNDAQLRSTIQGATNKSESFNRFVQWLSFGGEGVINSNNREEQRKIIRYNHLVANCLIFYNVFEISRILNELRQEGYPLDTDAVAALSPYWTQHVNRFGVYDLNLDRSPPPIDCAVQNILTQNA